MFDHITQNHPPHPPAPPAPGGAPARIHWQRGLLTLWHGFRMGREVSLCGLRAVVPAPPELALTGPCPDPTIGCPCCIAHYQHEVNHG